MKKVIILVDMDCFYVQVEKKLHPELIGKPCAVIQYKEWQGGSIIAVDYEARKYGVSRMIKGNEAKKMCPQLCLAKIPEKRGKADLSNYRKASADVMTVLSRFSKIIEKASIDEAFIDITSIVHKRISEFNFNRVQSDNLRQTHIAGIANKGLKSEESQVLNSNSESSDENEQVDEDTEPLGLEKWLEGEGNSEELSLAVGAMVTMEIREAVYQETGFTCSAGISHNKMLAKLAAGMNKPNQQTIFPLSQVSDVFNKTPFKKVRHLGGKLGENIKKTLNIEFVGQLTNYTLKNLQKSFGSKNGVWLYDVCRGIDHEPIRPRTIVQSIGCGKNFNGPEKLKTVQQVLHWLTELGAELVERLNEDMKENSRRAQTVTVSVSPDESPTSVTRSFPLHHYNVSSICSEAWTAINKGHCIATAASRVDPNESSPLTWTTGIRNIHISASKFVHSSITSTSMNSIEYFTRTKSSSSTVKEVEKGLDTPVNGVESPSKPSSTIALVSSTKDNQENERDCKKLKRENAAPSPKDQRNKACLITSYFTPAKRKLTVENKDQDTVDSEPLEQLTKKSKTDEASMNISTAATQIDTDDIPLTMCICSKCGEEILEINYPSHLDYHFAMSLQESFN